MNKKYFNIKNRNENALTDIVGTLLMLMIAISLFSVVYYFVFSVEGPDEPLHFNVIAYAEGNNVTLDHWGGDSVNLNDTQVILIVDGVRETPISLYDFHFKNEMDDGRSSYWEIGEGLYLDVSTTPVGDISILDVDIEIIDQVNNVNIMSGTINRLSDNRPPNTPSNPDPPDPSFDVFSLCTILRWTGGDPDGGVVTYDVYFGTNPLSLILESEDQLGTSFDPRTVTTILPDTTYYWNITAEDSYGLTSSSGTPWEFTTASGNLPPNPPDNLYPSDGADTVPVDAILSWTGDDPDQCDSLTYYVYFGIDSTPDETENISTQLSTTYDPILAPGVTYYWRINASDGEDIGESPIWWFTTASGPNNWPVISNPNPSDGETGLNLSPILSVDVSDLDLDAMDVTFYNASDDSTISSTQIGISSGSTVTTQWSGLSYFTTYSWYATAYDGTDNTTSATWSFTPGHFFDSFEDDNLDVVWDHNSDWYRSTDRSTDGTYSVQVDGASNTILNLTDAIDLSGETSAIITFDWFIETSFDDGDYLIFEMFDGTTWNEIDKLEGTSSGTGPDEDQWFEISEPITGLYLNENFKIRFIANCGASEEGNIDNIKIIGT